MLRNSACEGWVLHRRGEPHHEFRYRVWMLLVDPAQLARENSALIARRSPLAALQFRPTDYINAGGDVLQGVNEKLTERHLRSCDRVFVLSQPRSWGMFFNPVNFYFCFAAGDLHYVLAEINNTPWNEKHTYVMDARDQKRQGELRFEFPKAFHVSPFMPMDIDYRWRVKLEDDSIRIAIRLQKDGQELLFAGLYLSSHSVDEKTIARGRRRYVIQNLRTLARIYWQAAKLYRKRSTFYSHPELSNEATSP